MTTHAPLPPISPLRRFAIGAALVALLIAVYLVTYSGYAISRDEWFLFDATESMARRGDLRQNYEFDAFPPRTPEDTLPPPADSEPLQPILAVPLFLVAQILPGIGLVHTTWLFNVLVTALTAGVLYAWGLSLGYRARVVARVALVFGLGTIAWPYSRTFFREPLFTLLALLSVYLIGRVRQQLATGQRPLLPGIVFAAALAGTLLSKEAALLIVPALLVEAIPARRITRSTLIALVVLFLVGAGLLLVVLNLDAWFDVSITRWNLTDRLQQARSNINDMALGVRGYLYSPSRSMWVFSPVLLLGFAGWPRLVRTGRWREILVPTLMIASFIVGYAIVRGEREWYGGLGWGPRYLMPVTPFVALWLLPVVEALLAPGAARWARIGAGAVFLVSAGIQVLAALVPIEAYYDTLAAQTPRVIPWEGGMWTVRWSQIAVYADLLGDHTPDIAWRHAVGSAWLLPVFAAGLALIALGWLVWWVRRPESLPRPSRAFALTTGTLCAGTLIALFGSMTAIRHDPRYYGDFDRTRDLLAQIDANLQTGDVVVLNDFIYSEFFMNYFKHTDIPVYTLPVSPGRRFSAEQPPDIESPHPDDLLTEGTQAILARLADRHTRLWLVLDSSPYIPWSVRPVEHYLSRHYFPVRELKATDTARAVLFDTTGALPVPLRTWPDQTTGVTFGTGLHLAGYDIPGGTTRAPGDLLPVSLLWETRESIPQDYTIALLLMDDEQIVAQRDSFPVNHFEFTSTWQPGSLHRDNHAVALPDSLPPGTYDLWLVVYWWQEPAARLPVTRADGTPAGDHVTLGTITIR